MTHSSITTRGASAALWLTAVAVAATMTARQIATQHSASLTSDLTSAAAEGRVDSVRALARSGANINARTAETGTPLFTALWVGNLDMAEALLAEGASTTTDRPGDQGNLLSAACGVVTHDKVHEAKLDALIRRLLNEGEDVNYRDHSGLTALHRAAATGKCAIVRELIARGAEVNALGVDGNTPLHWATERGYVEVANDLVNHGANIEVRGRLRQTPLQIAVARKNGALVSLLKAHKAHEGALAAD